MGKGRLYSGKGIFELAWTGRAYEPGRQIDLPNDINIHSFARKTLSNGESSITTALSEGGKISVWTDDNNRLWESKDQYGGSKISLAIDPSAIGQNAEYRSKTQVFLQPRIILEDWDNSGLSSAIVIKNTNAVTNLLNQVRKYTSGVIEVLSLNEENPTVTWQSKEVKGHIADIIFEDITHDGRPELVAVQVEAGSGLSLFSSPESRILSW